MKVLKLASKSANKVNNSKKVLVLKTKHEVDELRVLKFISLKKLKAAITDEVLFSAHKAHSAAEAFSRMDREYFWSPSLCRWVGLTDTQPRVTENKWGTMNSVYHMTPVL